MGKAPSRARAATAKQHRPTAGSRHSLVRPVCISCCAQYRMAIMARRPLTRSGTWAEMGAGSGVRRGARGGERVAAHNASELSPICIQQLPQQPFPCSSHSPGLQTSWPAKGSRGSCAVPPAPRWWRRCWRRCCCCSGTSCCRTCAWQARCCCCCCSPPTPPHRLAHCVAAAAARSIGGAGMLMAHSTGRGRGPFRRLGKARCKGGLREAERAGGDSGW